MTSSFPTQAILVVEDEPEIRDLLRVALEMEDYSVITAPNGKEAWELLKSCPIRPWLIVLDLMMPVMDGWEFLELKSGSSEWKEIPAIIVSATSDKKMPAETRNQIILKKPIDLETFLNQVSRFRNLD